MLTELQQKRVWEGWLEGEARALYFAELAAGFHRRQKVLTFAALILASSALGAIVAQVAGRWPWLAPALTLVAAMLSLYALVGRFTECETESRVLYRRWNDLAAEYQALWDNQNAPNALALLNRIDRDAVAIGDATIRLPDRPERLDYWQEHVVLHHPAPSRA